MGSVQLHVDNKSGWDTGAGMFLYIINKYFRPMFRYRWAD